MNRTKKELKRNLFKLVRSNIENKEALSLAICKKLLGSEIYKNSDEVFLYASAGSEVSTDMILGKAFADGKKVAFPRCMDKEGNMEFYYVKAYDELQIGYYGIMTPPADFCAHFGSEHTLCIVPGIAFSKDGYRIGYGKGYYDRFLSGFKGVSVGFCYSQCLTDTLPVDETDKKVDYLITDKKIYDFT